MRVLVTGATGFVGRILCSTLAEHAYVARAALRRAQPPPAGAAETTVVGDIGRDTLWDEALRGVDAVVHAAARAHEMAGNAASEELYLETNARATQQLAEAAARCGVRRFVLLSSIKVNGDQTGTRPYTVDDAPHPHGAYARSKWLAEQSVSEIGARTGLRTAIVRPPLVYGPGVRANFLRLLQSVDAERLLPLGAIVNRRSLVSVWNLCDLLVSLVAHPEAEGRWLVSDGEDLSTPELVRRIARAMNRTARLIAVPPAYLQLCARLLGRGDEAVRLCGSLAVDISATRARLGWSPPLSVDEGLSRTVAWYLSQARP